MVLNPKKIFLIDASGALLSAFLLGVVLVSFEDFFGMPMQVLYYLAFIASLFAVYSFLCYVKVPENWPAYLRIIAILNLIYCFVTIGLVIHFYHQLTMFGVTYFISELLIVLSLIGLELKVTMNHSQSHAAS